MIANAGAPEPVNFSRFAAVLLILLLPVRSSIATDEWKDRKLMNVRYNMHNAFMSGYRQKSKSALRPAPGWMRNIGVKIASKAKMGLNRSWHFYVAKKDIPDIMTTPYGTVIVHQGMLELGLSRDEIAALIAHELAHVAKDHSVKVLMARMAHEKLGAFGDEKLGEKSGQIARLRELVMDLRYPLRFEGEADKFALVMLDRAGYKPETLLSALKKAGRGMRGNKEAFKRGYFRTHPGFWPRIWAATKNLKALKEGDLDMELPVVTGRPEIGRPTYMRRAMDEGYDYKKPAGKKRR